MAFDLSTHLVEVTFAISVQYVRSKSWQTKNFHAWIAKREREEEKSMSGLFFAHFADHIKRAVNPMKPARRHRPAHLCPCRPPTQALSDKKYARALIHTHTHTHTHTHAHKYTHTHAHKYTKRIRTHPLYKVIVTVRINKLKKSIKKFLKTIEEELYSWKHQSFQPKVVIF